MTKRIICLIAVCMMFLGVSAQTARERFETYRQQHRSQFEAFRSEKQKQFDEKRRQYNEAFARKLEGNWARFMGEKPIEPVKEEPIPPVIYQDPQPQPSPVPQPEPEPKPLPIEEKPIIIPQPEPQPGPIVPIAPIEQQPVVPVMISFYGTNVSIDFPSQDGFRMTGVKDKEISEAWRHLSGADYDVVVSSALNVRKQLNLCDWGYIQLVDLITQKHYGVNTNEAEMMLSFVLIQSGYKLRLARSNTRLFALIASRNTIYSFSYFTIGNERYYPLHASESSLQIADISFESEQPLSLQISGSQRFAFSATEKRSLSSTKKMQVTSSVNKNLIDFYNTYPTGALNDDFGTRWAMYANTPLDEQTKREIYPQIKSSIADFTPRDAVGKILNFVQTAFEYEYDDKVWGEDRAFFAAETLYYPYCDCEDRSILFSRLVRDLLGLKVVLLYYPGHLATAVDLGEDAKGDYVQYNGKRYIVCDPTYIGAPVGKTMPGMDNQTAKVIVL